MQLDFSGVRSVSRAFAEAILDGLDLVRVIDDLASETMASAVADVFKDYRILKY